MASESTIKPQAQQQESISVGRRMPAPSFNPFRIFSYVMLTAGALLFAMPFIWMVGKSLMSLGDANSSKIIPDDYLIDFQTVTPLALEVPLGEYMPEYVERLSFVTEREKNMSLGEYIEENDESWRLVDVWINGEQLLIGGRLLNYIKAWDEANFGEYFINTIIIAAMTVTGQTLFSIMAAYSFAQINFPGKNLIFGLFLAVLFVPASITNVPNFLMITQLDRMTGDILPWTDNWPALVIPFLASTFGIFLLRQFFMQIPSELWDAAQIDGAGHLRYLFTIVVPISRAAIMTTVLFTFMGTWNALEWPLLVTKGDEWRPISFGLYAFQNEAGTQTHLLMAASVIALVPILIMYFIAQKQLTEGIQTTGLKG